LLIKVSSEKEVQATLIKVDDAYVAISQLLELYIQSIPVKKGIENPSFISPSAQYGDNIYVELLYIWVKM
jgi:UDP-3-O-[3-hydroxymyristoyl] glucosamine N-acyltransferase